MTTSSHQFQSHLKTSREREIKLEDIIAKYNINPMESNSSSIEVKSDVAESKSAENDVKNTSDLDNNVLLKQIQDRSQEIQQELDQMQVNTDDLILEIEAVSNCHRFYSCCVHYRCMQVSSSEHKFRDQVSRLLSQTNHSQSMQRGLLEENLKLQESAADAQKKLSLGEVKSVSLIILHAIS